MTEEQERMLQRARHGGAPYAAMEAMESLSRDLRRQREEAVAEAEEAAREAAKAAQDAEDSRRKSQWCIAIVSALVNAAVAGLISWLVARNVAASSAASAPDVHAEPEQRLERDGQDRGEGSRADHEAPVVLGLGDVAVAGAGEESEFHDEGHAVKSGEGTER